MEHLMEEAEKTLFSVSQTFVKDRFIHVKDILAQTYEKFPPSTIRKKGSLYRRADRFSFRGRCAFGASAD